jgi:DNA-binding LytR/AlgR family response regulator
MTVRPATANVVHITDAPGLQIIVCVLFNRNAPPDQVSALKKAVIACPSVLNAVELTGTFDFLLELTVPDIATFNERLNLVAASVASLVERYEVNFVSKRVIRRNDDERAIWVQCEDGIKRIDSSMIDKVTAEGDYMRVHSEGGSWLLHATMRSILERLDDKDFIRINRSMLVRADFIDRLVHESGRWVARLHDGTHERVAKSHVTATLKQLRTN